MIDYQFGVLVGVGIGIFVQLIAVQSYLKDILAELRKKQP